MLVSMLKAKLHGAVVTGASLHYQGSITIDAQLMNGVGIRPFEKVLVANMANGARFETYAIEGEPGSGVVCLNGATSHKGSVGDRVIVFTFALMDEAAADAHKPAILLLDEDNKPRS